jgi:hypothetical protein
LRPAGDRRGPAGLIAAQTAAEAGADVILIDENTELGGRLLSDSEEIGGKPGDVWAAEMQGKLAAMDNVRIMTRTTVTGVYDGLNFGALERVGLHLPHEPDLPRECFWRITAKSAVLAAGALERPIAFPMNDRPGIMLASAVRTYLNRYGVAPGRNLTLFATNDDAHRTARGDAGRGPARRRRDRQPHGRAKRGDYRLIEGGQVVTPRAATGCRQITVSHGGRTEEIETDCLAMSGGWNPSVHLTCHLGARPVWDADAKAFLPAPNAVPGMIPRAPATGRCRPRPACRGQGGREGGAEDARPERQARHAAQGLRRCRRRRRAVVRGGQGPRVARLRQRRDDEGRETRRAGGLHLRRAHETLHDTGMAPDQGKSSNIAALALLADTTGRGIPETGTTTYRPPFIPVSIGAMAAGAEQKGFAPERFTTSDRALRSWGAPMIAVGLWYRPSYLPKTGGDALAPILRPRGADGARGGRRRRRLHAGQDRHSGAPTRRNSSTSSIATCSPR